MPVMHAKSKRLLHVLYSIIIEICFDPTSHYAKFW